MCHTISDSSRHFANLAPISQIFIFDMEKERSAHQLESLLNRVLDFFSISARIKLRKGRRGRGRLNAFVTPIWNMMSSSPFRFSSYMKLLNNSYANRFSNEITYFMLSHNRHILVPHSQLNSAATVPTWDDQISTQEAPTSLPNMSMEVKEALIGLQFVGITILEQKS